MLFIFTVFILYWFILVNDFFKSKEYVVNLDNSCLPILTPVSDVCEVIRYSFFRDCDGWLSSVFKLSPKLLLPGRVGAKLLALISNQSDPH